MRPASQSIAVLSLLVCAGGMRAQAQPAAPVAYADVSAAQPMTIDQAWDRLQGESGAIRAARLGSESARLEAQAQRSLVLPRITASVTALKLQKSFDNDISAVSGPINQALANIGQQTGLRLPPVPSTFNTAYENQGVRPAVSMLWPLYTGGKITAAQRLAEAKGDEADARLRQTSEATSTSLAQTYFGLQLARQGVAVQQQVVATLEQHVRQARGFERQGQIARLETLHAQAALDEQKRSLLKVQDEAELAQVALDRLLDMPQGVRPVSPLFLRSRPLEPLPYWLDAGLAANPSLSLLDAKRMQSEQGVAAARAAALPSVAAFGEYQFNKSVLTPVEPDWIIGLTVKLTLLDNVDRRNMIDAAQAQHAQVEALNQQARRDLSTGIEKAWREVEQTRQRYLLLQSTMAEAEENFRLRSASFREGQSTSLDVVDARLMLARAQIERARAAHDYDVALARLLELSGASGRLPALSASADIRVSAEPGAGPAAGALQPSGR